MISIVIPIYNAREHLPKCIESILEQGYSDFELLLNTSAVVIAEIKLIKKAAYPNALLEKSDIPTAFTVKPKLGIPQKPIACDSSFSDISPLSFRRARARVPMGKPNMSPESTAAELFSEIPQSFFATFEKGLEK